VSVVSKCVAQREHVITALDTFKCSVKELKRQKIVQIRLRRRSVARHLDILSVQKSAWHKP
jgi:hypothetical protein